MCIAVPMKVVEIKDNYAICEYECVRKTARIDLMKDIKVGDYVLIHVGFVIQKINEKDAQTTLNFLKQQL